MPNSYVPEPHIKAWLSKNERFGFPSKDPKLLLKVIRDGSLVYRIVTIHNEGAPAMPARIVERWTYAAKCLVEWGIEITPTGLKLMLLGEPIALHSLFNCLFSLHHAGSQGANAVTNIPTNAVPEKEPLYPNLFYCTLMNANQSNFVPRVRALTEGCCNPRTTEEERALLFLEALALHAPRLVEFKLIDEFFMLAMERINTASPAGTLRVAALLKNFVMEVDPDACFASVITSRRSDIGRLHDYIADTWKNDEALPEIKEFIRLLLANICPHDLVPIFKRVIVPRFSHRRRILQYREFSRNPDRTLVASAVPFMVSQSMAVLEGRDPETEAMAAFNPAGRFDVDFDELAGGQSVMLDPSSLKSGTSSEIVDPEDEDDDQQAQAEKIAQLRRKLRKEYQHEIKQREVCAVCICFILNLWTEFPTEAESTGCKNDFLSFFLTERGVEMVCRQDILAELCCAVFQFPQLYQTVLIALRGVARRPDQRRMVLQNLIDFHTQQPLASIAELVEITTEVLSEAFALGPVEANFITMMAATLSQEQCRYSKAQNNFCTVMIELIDMDSFFHKAVVTSAGLLAKHFLQHETKPEFVKDLVRVVNEVLMLSEGHKYMYLTVQAIGMLYIELVGNKELKETISQTMHMFFQNVMRRDVSKLEEADAKAFQAWVAKLKMLCELMEVPSTKIKMKDLDDELAARALAKKRADELAARLAREAAEAAERQAKLARGEDPALAALYMEQRPDGTLEDNMVKSEEGDDDETDGKKPRGARSYRLSMEQRALAKRKPLYESHFGEYGKGSVIQWKKIFAWIRKDVVLPLIDKLCRYCDEEAYKRMIAEGFHWDVASKWDHWAKGRKYTDVLAEKRQMEEAAAKRREQLRRIRALEIKATLRELRAQDIDHIASLNKQQLLQLEEEESDERNAVSHSYIKVLVELYHLLRNEEDAIQRSIKGQSEQSVAERKRREMEELRKQGELAAKLLQEKKQQREDEERRQKEEEEARAKEQEERRLKYTNEQKKKLMTWRLQNQIEEEAAAAAAAAVAAQSTERKRGALKPQRHKNVSNGIGPGGAAGANSSSSIANQNPSGAPGHSPIPMVTKDHKNQRSFESSYNSTLNSLPATHNKLNDTGGKQSSNDKSLETSDNSPNKNSTTLRDGGFSDAADAPAAAAGVEIVVSAAPDDAYEFTPPSQLEANNNNSSSSGAAAAPPPPPASGQQLGVQQQQQKTPPA